MTNNIVLEEDLRDYKSDNQDLVFVNACYCL